MTHSVVVIDHQNRTAVHCPPRSCVSSHASRVLCPMGAQKQTRGYADAEGDTREPFRWGRNSGENLVFALGGDRPETGSGDIPLMHRQRAQSAAEVAKVAAQPFDFRAQIREVAPAIPGLIVGRRRGLVPVDHVPLSLKNFPDDQSSQSGVGAALIPINQPRFPVEPAS